MTNGHGLSRWEVIDALGDAVEGLLYAATESGEAWGVGDGLMNETQL